MTDGCSIRGCRGEVELIYHDRGLCDRHWNQLMADDAFRARLRMGLGLDGTTSPALEGDMSEPTNGTETTATAAEKVAEEKTMPTKSTKKTRAAKPKPKATKQAKAPKQTKTKEPAAKGPKPDRTFAIRITSDELAAIHKASGPRNATKFVRAVAAAFADGDEAAFRAVVKEAREARG